MRQNAYIFGPVPSRRLGRSLGISPITEKTCNYSCVYCQLGRTRHLTNKRSEFFPVDDLLREFDRLRPSEGEYDVVSIVGEGEPTLYSRLGDLITGLKERIDKPIAVITNGSLLYDAEVRNELMHADIVMSSMDAYDDKSFHEIDRHCTELSYRAVYEGLVTFSKEYTGALYLEIMLMGQANDDMASLLKYKAALCDIQYDKLYLNTPVRPPAENNVRMVSPSAMQKAAKILGGIPIDVLTAGNFYSDIADDYEAVINIIGRHPMNQHEIGSFLMSRKTGDPTAVLKRLEDDPSVTCSDYMGFITYRLNWQGNDRGAICGKH